MDATGLTDDKSTLVQVMAWCRQTTSHYPSQCWPRSLSPYGIARPNEFKCGVTAMAGHFNTLVKCLEGLNSSFIWILQIHNFCFIFPVSLKFCTEHCSITAVHFVKLQNEWTVRKSYGQMRFHEIWVEGEFWRPNEHTRSCRINANIMIVPLSVSWLIAMTSISVQITFHSWE